MCMISRFEIWFGDMICPVNKQLRKPPWSFHGLWHSLVFLLVTWCIWYKYRCSREMYESQFTWYLSPARQRCFWRKISVGWTNLDWTQKLYILWRILLEIVAGKLYIVCGEYLYSANTHKLLKNTRDESNMQLFCCEPGNFYTWQEIFAQTPSVASVTNMRYGLGASNFS